LAFGIGPDGPQQSQTNDEGIRIFKAGGGGNLPSSVAATVNEIIGQDYVMMANLIQNAGPALSPAIMQARAPSLPAVGGGDTGQALLQFGPNNWGWQQDNRVMFWSRTQKSSYNGQPGTFISMEGP